MRRKRGFLLLEAIIAVMIAGVVAMVFTSINYYANIQSNMVKIQTTKQSLEVIRSRLLDSANDIDSDGYFELLASDSNNLPTAISLTTDSWGRAIVYYPQDIGVVNTNSTYTQNRSNISPNSNIVARVISAGEDGNIETTATDSKAIGDDIVLEISTGELNHYKLYKGSEVSSQTRGYNSAIISNTAPTSPTNGLIWLDTSTTPNELKVYDGTSWKSASVN
jgi:type II secretory pathway pseudopilin PulG